MNLLEKLDALKEAKGVNNAALAREAGIPATTIYGLYEKGYANMKLSTLEALSNYFGVSLDYLAKDDGESPVNVSSGFSADEMRLIAAYRLADPTARQIALETLENHPAKMEDQRLA